MLVAMPWSPTFSAQVGDIIAPTLSASAERFTNSVGLGLFSLNFTVSGSTTSTLSMVAVFPLAVDFGWVIIRFRFHLTASALKSVPSWNLTPLGSLKITVFGSGISQDSASAGLTSQAFVWGFRTTCARYS